MKNIKKIALIFLLLVSLLEVVRAGDDNNSYNTIPTGVPFLTIAPDAIGGGKGDVGAGSKPDLYSQYWNPAKYAFTEKDMSIGLAYTPWLRNLVSDIGLAYLVAYKKLDNRQTISASLDYFALGDIIYYDDYGYENGQQSPVEFSIDFAYTRKLSNCFSGSVALRMIYSNIAPGVEGIKPGYAYASDVAFYYYNNIESKRRNQAIYAGINISNIGSKISYDEGETHEFIPTNMRLGVGYNTEIDNYNSLGFYLDANKLLVKTPDSEISNSDYESTSVMSSIFHSFNDAPGGIKEELQEITFSGGVEYEYNEQFSLRVGYFYENAHKGNRKYVSMGTGFKLNVFALDFSYLVSTIQNNPLNNTLRISLSFDINSFNRKNK